MKILNVKWQRATAMSCVKGQNDEQQAAVPLQAEGTSHRSHPEHGQRVRVSPSVMTLQRWLHLSVSILLHSSSFVSLSTLASHKSFVSISRIHLIAQALIRKFITFFVTQPILFPRASQILCLLESRKRQIINKNILIWIHSLESIDCVS